FFISFSFPRSVVTAHLVSDLALFSIIALAAHNPPDTKSNPVQPEMALPKSSKHFLQFRFCPTTYGIFHSGSPFQRSGDGQIAHSGNSGAFVKSAWIYFMGFVPSS